MDYFYDDEITEIGLLADYLGIDEDEITGDGYGDPSLVHTPKGTYYVGTYYDLRLSAIDNFCEEYDEVGVGLLKQQGIKEYLDYAWDDSAVERWYKDWLEEPMEEMVNNGEFKDELVSYGIIDESEAKYWTDEELLQNDDICEAYKNARTEYIFNEYGSLWKYYLDFYGMNEQSLEYAERMNMFDISELAQYLVEDVYGLAHELSYNNKEIVLGEIDGDTIYAYKVYSEI